jgi:hypothetical protein
LAPPSLLQRDRDYRFSELDLKQLAGHHPHPTLDDPIHESSTRLVKPLTLDQSLYKEARIKRKRVWQQQRRLLDGMNGARTWPRSAPSSHYRGRYMSRVTCTFTRSPVVARRTASRFSSSVFAVGSRVIAGISPGVNRFSLGVAHRH